MRFLCLHGLGTNSEILESQFQPIRSLLPFNWEFEFLDGEEETNPTHGNTAHPVQMPNRANQNGNPPKDIGKNYPGPYLCYYDEPTPKVVQSAVELVLEVVDEDGPFDAVLGFSYGASLAVTVLATAAERHPDKPPPFKCAVLFNTIIPYRLGSGPLHLTYDISIPGEGSVINAHRSDYSAEQNKKYNVWKDPEAEAIVAELDARLLENQGSTGVKGSGEFLLAYYAPIHGHRIHVPTVHVHGEADHSYREQSRRVVEICDPTPGRKVITHRGGHHFPREAATIAKVVNAIEWVVEKGAHHVPGI